MTGQWRKSTYSNPSGNCVEVATSPQGVAVRDSKNPSGPVLRFTAGQWSRLVRDMQETGKP